MSASDPSALLARIERLERHNRRLQLTLPALLLAGAACLLLGLAPPAARVEAESFVLKDSRGVVRGGWSASAGGETSLILNSRAGKPRLRLKLLQGEFPRVELIDAQGRARTILASFPGGYSGLSLNDNSGKPRASLYVDAKDTPRLGLLDSKGVTRGGFGVLPDGTPHLSLRDARKRTVLSLYADSRGAPRVELFKKMQATMRLAVSPDGSRGLVLFDDRGKPLGGLGVNTAGDANLRLINRKGQLKFKAP